MKDSISRYYKWFVALVWAALILSIYSQFINLCPTNQSLLFAGSFFIVAFPITTFLSKYLLPKALRSGKISKFVMQFILATLVLAFLMACINNSFVWLERKEIFPISVMFTSLARPLHLEFLGNITGAFAANLIFCAIYFFNEHLKVQQEHAKLQQAHLEDELHLLRAQINPHLMFNVLNHIHILMKKNVDVADELLLRYSDVLRYQLYECNRETVSLEKEVEYLKDVVEVEKMRWGNELNVNCSWSIENGKVEISPLLLIPFVENAFKHVSRSPSEVGYVNIMLNQENDALRLVVENSKTNQPLQRKNASGLGLENVKKRLDILYPGKHELVVQKTDTVYKTTLVITL